MKKQVHLIMLSLFLLLSQVMYSGGYRVIAINSNDPEASPADTYKEMQLKAKK